VVFPIAAFNVLLRFVVYLARLENPQCVLDVELFVGQFIAEVLPRYDFSGTHALPEQLYRLKPGQTFYWNLVIYQPFPLKSKAESCRFRLTRQEKYANRVSVMPNYSTAQVAERLGIHKATLIRWLLDGKVREPRRVNHVGQEIRIWTDRDVERVQRYKQENYRKGRGRKPTLKRSGMLPSMPKVS